MREPRHRPNAFFFKIASPILGVATADRRSLCCFKNNTHLHIIQLPTVQCIAVRTVAWFAATANVINSQQHDGTFNGCFDGLCFDSVRFPNSHFRQICNATIRPIDTKIGVLAIGVQRSQFRHHPDRITTAILTQRSRYYFKSIT